MDVQLQQRPVTCDTPAVHAGPGSSGSCARELSLAPNASGAPKHFMIAPVVQASAVARQFR